MLSIESRCSLIWTKVSCISAIFYSLLGFLEPGGDVVGIGCLKVEAGLGISDLVPGRRARQGQEATIGLDSKIVGSGGIAADIDPKMAWIGQILKEVVLAVGVALAGSD